MDRHLDPCLVAGRHDRLQEIFQVFPQLFLGHRAVCLEQFVQLRHPLRLPSRKCHSVQIVQDVIRHFLIIVLNPVLFVEQRRGAVLQRVEQICPGPVKNGHKVVGHDLHAELRQIAQRSLIVFDILVSGKKPDLDIVMHVHALHHVHVEARALDLAPCLLDLFHLPDLSGLLVMQRPDQPGHSRDLFDHLRGNAVVSLAVPAKCHLHNVVLLYFQELPQAAPCSIPCLLCPQRRFL